MSPRVRIDRRELLPGRGWFIAAGSIAMIFILAGVGVFLTIAGVNGEITVGEEFDTGENATIQMNPDTKTGIFARVGYSNHSPEAGTVPAPAAECTVISPAGQPVPLSRPDGENLVIINGVIWYQIYAVTVPEDGDYRVTCQSDETRRFAVGGDVAGTASTGAQVGGIVALVVLPLIGLAIAGTITAVAVRRRLDDTFRLAAERSGFPDLLNRW